MKNNRNTLLLISGIGFVVNSVVNMVLLLLVSLFHEIVEAYIKLEIVSSGLYAYSPNLAETFATTIFIMLFAILCISMLLSFETGIICIGQSNLGAEKLTKRNLVIILSIINLVLLNGAVFAILGLVSLLIDKNQPNDEKIFNAEDVKIKINELKKLKEDKVITQKEFLDLVTKLLVE